jgi:hypothetical protein
MSKNTQDISDVGSFAQRPGYDRTHNMLVDERSSTEYFIGNSKNGVNTSKPIWRIKKIWKIGSVWHFGFPNGNEDFTFVWDNRSSSYTYK